MILQEELYLLERRDQNIMKNGNESYFIKNGFKFSRFTYPMNRDVYKVFNTWTDSYQEIASTIELQLLYKNVEQLHEQLYKLSKSKTLNEYENRYRQIEKSGRVNL